LPEEHRGLDDTALASHRLIEGKYPRQHQQNKAHSTCFAWQDVLKIMPNPAYSEVLADNRSYHALYFFNIIKTIQNASYFN
jgi:hypothetical protein